MFAWKNVTKRVGEQTADDDEFALSEVDHASRPQDDVDPERHQRVPAPTVKPASTSCGDCCSIHREYGERQRFLLSRSMLELTCAFF